MRGTGGNYRIFNVTSEGTVSLSGLTIQNGLTAVNDNGAGIQSVSFSGTVTITNCVLQMNSAANGGAIANANGGTVNVINSTVSGNSASESGGGIANT